MGLQGESGRQVDRLPQRLSDGGLAPANWRIPDGHLVRRGILFPFPWHALMDRAFRCCHRKLALGDGSGGGCVIDADSLGSGYTANSAYSITVSSRTGNK